LEAERKLDELRAKRRVYNNRYISNVKHRVENGVLLQDLPTPQLDPQQQKNLQNKEQKTKAPTERTK